MKIYMDVCCLCRPFDDRTQDRIRIESEAVLAVLSRCPGDWILIGSEVIDFELSMIFNLEKRRGAKLLASIAEESAAMDDGIIERASELEHIGFKPMDALHISCAERTADIMLTTDEGILKKASTNREFIRIKINNPVRWLQDVL